MERWRGGIYLHIHFCLTRGPAGCPGPAIRTLARVLIQSFHDCAALAALPSAGVTTHCKYLQWRYSLHTHSLRAAPLHSLERQVRHGLDVGSEVLVLGSAMVECWVICRHCPSVARPGAGGGVVRGGGRGAAVLRRVRLVRGRRRARRGEDGGQLRGLALDLLYILCSDSFRF